MSKLTTAARNALPDSAFAGPNRTYPIPDASHARNAKARASQFASPALKARVDAAVGRRYPGMGSNLANKYRAKKKG